MLFWSAVQVNAIHRHKKALFRDIPQFDDRAKASAALAVVQDYLISHIALLPCDATADTAAAGQLAVRWVLGGTQTVHLTWC